MQEVDQGTIEERWQWIKRIVDGAMEKKNIRIRRKKISFKIDGTDCTRRKRRVQRSFCAWKKGR